MTAEAGGGAEQTTVGREKSRAFVSTASVPGTLGGVPALTFSAFEITGL